MRLPTFKTAAEHDSAVVKEFLLFMLAATASRLSFELPGDMAQFGYLFLLVLLVAGVSAAFTAWSSKSINSFETEELEDIVAELEDEKVSRAVLAAIEDNMRITRGDLRLFRKLKEAVMLAHATDALRDFCASGIPDIRK